MTSRVETLTQTVAQVLGGMVVSATAEGGEVTIVTKPQDIVGACLKLRDDMALRFELLIDVCGVDYSEHGGNWQGQRYAVVYHLLSVTHNWRIRVRSFLEDDEFPQIPSVLDVWPAANWYERETFDLYGIIFNGHPDLRRILTDYGFIGHPFRKDFPISGNVEMRYDPEQQRVIYQPVTIEPREVVPRVRREESYGDTQ